MGGLQKKIVFVHILYFSFFSLYQSGYVRGMGRGARQYGSTTEVGSLQSWPIFIITYYLNCQTQNCLLNKTFWQWNRLKCVDWNFSKVMLYVFTIGICWGVSVASCCWMEEVHIFVSTLTAISHIGTDKLTRSVFCI